MELSDMHAHILPGLDDGVRTIEETMQVLREARRQKITRMILTPHYHPDRYPVRGALVHRVLEEVKNRCVSEKIEMELFAGQECFYYTGLVQKLKNKEILTLAGSRYVLVEFDTDSSFSYIQNGLINLRESGFEPILAHVERYNALKAENEFLRLKEYRFLMQVNYDSIIRITGLSAKRIWNNRLRSGKIDFLGSDCHGQNFRPLQVDRAYRRLEKKADANILETILVSNFECILSDRKI